MELTLDFTQYTFYLLYGTLAFGVLSAIAWFAQWGLRFRLVGATGFMMVLTVGMFGLSLGLFTRQVVPGAVTYSLVYDNGANQAVIAVAPDVTPDQVAATLQQAANDLYSYGRSGAAVSMMHVRARTLIHPQDGVSQPVYLGEAERSLGRRDSGAIAVQVNEENFSAL